MPLARRLAAAACVAVLAFTSAAALAQEQPAGEAEVNPAAIIARVGDSVVTELDLQIVAEALDQQLRAVPPAQQRSILIDTLVNMELLANAARAAGFEDRPEYALQLEFLKMQALRNAYVDEVVMGPLSEEELQAGYQANVVDPFAPEEEIRARHILVDTEEEAAAIIEQLRDGAAFEDLASVSKDFATVPEGGDLGFFARGQMVPVFEEAAFALAPGEFTPEPVESQFGWHVIKVEEARMSEPPTLAEVADQLVTFLQQKRFEEKLAELHDLYEVEILEEPELP